MYGWWDLDAHFLILARPGDVRAPGAVGVSGFGPRTPRYRRVIRGGGPAGPRCGEVAPGRALKSAPGFPVEL